MPPTNSDAHQFAAQAHAGQIDKAGKPYIRQVNRVAGATNDRAIHAFEIDGLKINPDQVLQAAYLHDVLEDTSTTAHDLAQAGYVPPVIRMVQLFSKTDEELSYAERIGALIQSGNLGAILIKLSDNEDNANTDRQSPVGIGPTARYAASMPRLRNAAAALGFTGS